ncbi:MAG TPA: hypothetical protein VMX38_06975 [Verrucomicrobiae bacterium]|jgi:hypothetical protein|nr:hypothetical protein [Verrucomicrobiae bacterium]
MGLFDAFRKDEVVGAKVLVCALDAKHEDLRERDERIYRRFYAATTSVVPSTVAELKQSLSQAYDIVHLLCDVNPEGALVDSSRAKLSGDDLLKTCVDAGVKLLWLGSDNFAEQYNAGFHPKGMKLNVILTERRLGPNFSLFLDGLLSKLSAGESVSKAWNVASKPEGKSVQPDVPHTITSLGRGSVILR